MRLHEHECAYCGSLARWREVDVPPAKCASCGARGPRAKPRGPTIRAELLYGFLCPRPTMQAKLADPVRLAFPGDIFDTTGISVERLGENRWLVGAK